MKFKSHVKVAMFFLMAISLLIGSGCARPQLAQPDQLTAPTPIQDNSGVFMAPYTSDEVLAEWVDMAVKAKAASGIGGAIGAYAGAKALEQIPFVGGFLGKKVGNKIGKEIAIKAAGGRESIMATSDLSFENVDELAVWLYVKHSTNEHYQSAYDATAGIYPEFKERYGIALMDASKLVLQ